MGSRPKPIMDQNGLNNNQISIKREINDFTENSCANERTRRDSNKKHSERDNTHHNKGVTEQIDL